MDRFATRTGDGAYEVYLSTDKTISISSDNTKLIDDRIFNLTFVEMKLFLQYALEIEDILDNWKRPLEEQGGDLWYDMLNGFWETYAKDALRRRLNQFLVTKSETGGFIIRVTETLTFEIENVKGEITGRLHNGANYSIFSEDEIEKLLEMVAVILECMEEFGFCASCEKTFLSVDDSKCECGVGN